MRGCHRFSWGAAFLIAFLSAYLPPPLLYAAEVSIRDDAGREVRLKAPARRVIPLYAAFTDMFTAMDRAVYVIARTKADTGNGLPPETPIIGTHMRPNMELVLALKPDLVLQMGGRAEAAQSVAALEKFAVPAAFFEVRSFSDLFSVIERVGILTGTENEAKTLVAALKKRLAAVAATIASAPARRPSVFFEVRYPNLLAAGPDSLVTDIIRAAGGRNALVDEDAPGAVASRYKGRVVRLSEEELIRLNPDFYCIQSGPMNKNPVPLAERPHFASLRAAKPGRNALVDEHIFSRPGPRAVDAVARLARLLHPGLFPASESRVQEIKQ